MVILVGLNLVGIGWASTLTWIFQSIVLVGNVVILYSNLTAVKSVQAAFARKGDPVLAGIDVAPLLQAAEDGFPAWTWQKIRHLVVFGASIVVLLALAIA